MKQVAELKGDEGGRWRIWTQHSSYLLDLDVMTITRIRGANSSPSINDCERPLRSRDRCGVGAIGFWTMHAGADSDLVDYFWQFSTEISSIERLSDENS
jgi:hypothetical protein